MTPVRPGSAMCEAHPQLPRICTTIARNTSFVRLCDFLYKEGYSVFFVFLFLSSGPLVLCSCGPPVPWSRGSWSLSNYLQCPRISQAGTCCSLQQLKRSKTSKCCYLQHLKRSKTSKCSISRVPKWNCQRSKTSRLALDIHACHRQA